jgi:hypothetical protein
MNTQNSRAGLVVGLALIGLGLLFLLQQFLNFNFWDTLWPILVLGVGGLFLAAAALGGRDNAALFVPGSLITMVGAILFVLNLTDHWEAWAYAWTLIIAAVGIGLMLHGARTQDASLQRRGQQTLQSGLVMLLIFGAFFELIVFGSGRTAQWAWPVLLIAVGLYLLVRRTLWGRPSVASPNHDLEKRA